MGAVLTAECERAHSWVSLGLDGELSEVEQALLRAHVGRCAACAGFALDMDALTRELRTAPLARPAVAGMPLRRRSAGRPMLRVGAAAAAVALAAGLGSLAGSLHSRQSPAFTIATTGAPSAAGANVATARDGRLPAGRAGRSIAL
jgi:predicted anti-sigma-YlaC factor YlaD